MSIRFCKAFHPNMNSTIALPLRSRYSQHYCPKGHLSRSSVPVILSVLGTSRPVSEFAGDDVLEAFKKEREVSGDFIVKLCDKIWLRATNGTANRNKNAVLDEVSNKTIQLPEQGLVEENGSGGFLKLRSTTEWVMGDTLSAPVNKKMTTKELRYDSERMRKLNLLRYEALKRELLVVTVGIGTACSGYCLVVLSVKAALSYEIGVLFSCLYLQLLCQHVDNISRENIPNIFMRKKSKKIGIRSQDLQALFERSIKGTGVTLSSPRLVIPVTIYGLWELCQHFGHDFLDFQVMIRPISFLKLQPMADSGLKTFVKTFKWLMLGESFIGTKYNYFVALALFAIGCGKLATAQFSFLYFADHDMFSVPLSACSCDDGNICI